MVLRNGFSLAAALLAMVLFGCNSETAPAPETASPEAAEDGDHSHADDHAHDDEHGDEHGHESAEASAEMSEEEQEIEAQLAKLSPEDQKLARQQKICPVSDEPLGSMGVPMKINVEGRDVFICCEGCEKPVKENPEKFLAKLDLPAESEAKTEADTETESEGEGEGEAAPADNPEE